jgi:hypothetical protein
MEVVAAFSATTAPGTYLLTLTTKPLGVIGVMDVTLGAQGVAGPAGPAGPTGVVGPAGPAGTSFGTFTTGIVGFNGSNQGNPSDYWQLITNSSVSTGTLPVTNINAAGGLNYQQYTIALPATTGSNVPICAVSPYMTGSLAGYASNINPGPEAQNPAISNGWGAAPLVWQIDQTTTTTTDSGHLM